MKLYSALFFVLVANSVFAGEVGALDPESSKVASSFDVAIAEIGASNSWESEVNNFSVVPAENASTRQVKALNEHMGAINNQVNERLSDLIEAKVSEAFSF